VAPPVVALAADAGAFATVGGEHVGVPGVRIAPAQVGLQGSVEHHVVEVVGPARTKERSRPKCASIGLAHEA